MTLLSITLWLPILVMPFAFISGDAIRYRAAYIYGAAYLALAVLLLISGIRESPSITGGVFNLTPRGAALFLAYATIQFVSLLSLPRHEMTRGMLFGTALLALSTLLTTMAVEPHVFLVLFVISLFIPFLFCLMHAADTVAAGLFFIIGIVCAALVVLGASDRLIEGKYPMNYYLLGAMALRLGIVPLHIWVRRMVLRFPIQWSLLFFLSYPTIALPMHIQFEALETAQQLFLYLAWITALYGSCLALVQDHLRTAFYYLLLSLFGSIGVGFALASDSTAQAGVLLFWIAAGLAFAGFGLCIEMLEARFGRLTTSHLRRSLNSAPLLGALFLLFGLASVGFPGMCAFVGQEVMLHGIYAKRAWAAFPILLAFSLNGITVLRWFLILFYGRPGPVAEEAELLPRERLAFLLLLLIIIATGVYPRPFFSFHGDKNEHFHVASDGSATIVPDTK